MKYSLITILLIPFLSFGQVEVNELSKKDKKSIDEYANSICDCVNEHMATLHPKVIEVVLLLGEKGQEEAMKDVEMMLVDMDPEESQVFLESFAIMESEEFMGKIANCGDSDDLLSPEIKEQIENAEGLANDYLIELLNREEACEVMKALYNLGVSLDE